MPLDRQLLAKDRLVLVSDLDWTMVDHNDQIHDKLLCFNRLWTTQFASDSILVFSTGRSPELFQSLAAEVPLLKPDILVCSVGTEILVNGRSDTEWEAHLSQGWDRERVVTVAGRFPELVMQRQSEQRTFKASYKLYAADAGQAAGTVSNLRGQLAAAGLDTNVIFSGGEDLDILPAKASKGKALSFVLKQLEEGTHAPPHAGVLVCGDSGNDIELFAVPGVYGCMVANAHRELRDWCESNGNEKLFKATEDGPGGIQQALYHFGFAHSQLEPHHIQRIGRRREVVDLHAVFEDYFNSSGQDGDSSSSLEGAANRPTPTAVSRLETCLAQDFEIVSPSGVVTPREDLLKWFLEQGQGSRLPGKVSATAADPLAPQQQQLEQGLLAAAMAAAADTAGVRSGSSTPSAGASGPLGMEPSANYDDSKFRIWIDRYREDEVAPGVWLVRYMELQQRFLSSSSLGSAEGGASSFGRTGRWTSAVLKELASSGEESSSANGGTYEWVYVHETWAAPNALVTAGGGAGKDD